MSNFQLSSSTGFLLADGSCLAVGFPGYDRAFMLSSYWPSSIDIQTSVVDISYAGGYFNTNAVTGREEITITIHGRGPFLSAPIDEAIQIFRSVDSMSVNDLLAAAYRKMSDRQSSL